MVADVVVIGGGIVGAGAAYRLVSAGATVTVVDRSDAGHATAAGAGIVDCPIAGAASGDPRAELASRACEYYRQLIPQLADGGCADTGYERIGALMLAADDGERARLAQEFDRHLPGGVIAHLKAPRPKQLFPLLRDDIDAVHIPGTARVDGRRLRDALLHGVEQRAGTLVKGDARLMIESGRVTGATVDGERISAGAVIVAGGAWDAAVAGQLGVYPERGQILHLAVPDVHTGGWPILMGYQRHYILTFPENRVIAGATHEEDSGYDHRVTAAGQAELIAHALRWAPGLAAATVVETRVGFRPKTRDGLPILGAVPDVDGLFVANGLGEDGLMMGPYVGAVVADLAIGERVPLDLTPFRAGRASLA